MVLLAGRATGPLARYEGTVGSSPTRWKLIRLASFKPNSPRDTCSMRRPEVRYANSGGVRIAYQVFGEGPFDIVVAPSLVTHVELQWKVRQWAEFND